MFLFDAECLKNMSINKFNFNIAANNFLLLADHILTLKEVIDIIKIFQNGVKEQQYVKGIINQFKIFISIIPLTLNMYLLFEIMSSFKNICNLILI